MTSHTYGKVILAGEHAVVYGKMALATSISLGVTARVVESEGSKKNPIVDKAIEVAGGDPSLQIQIESKLPVGSGMGSSAAVAAAVIKAVREHLNNPIGDDELFKLTMECEKVAHGNPSGVDPAVVVYGGLIAYIKGQPIEKLKILKPLKLILVDTGKPTETTRQMVELVAQNPDKDRVVEQIEGVVKQIKNSLVEGGDVSGLINQNGLLLQELGVVGERAMELSEELRKMGASVKITGAGGVSTGSGMMIVMARDFAKIRKLLDNNQIDYFETTIGEL